MTEEQAPLTPATGEATEQQTATPAEAATPPAESAPDWQKLLDTVDPDQLSRHPRVAGILGSRIDQALRRREAEMTSTARQKASLEQDEELFRLLDENDETIRERYPKAYQGLKARREASTREELDRQLGESKRAFAQRIGAAYQVLPEWKELTPQDYDSIQKAVQGLPDDEVVAAFTAKATDLIADKREARRRSKWEAEELGKLRETIRQEEAAKLLASTPAPDTRRGAGTPGGIDVNKLSDAEFNEWYNKNVKR